MVHDNVEQGVFAENTVCDPDHVAELKASNVLGTIFIIKDEEEREILTKTARAAAYKLLQYDELKLCYRFLNQKMSTALKKLQ
jgi:hypothetical protein